MAKIGVCEDSTMRIRATVKLRNDKMIAARERLGLSQSALASQSGVSFQMIVQLESLNYSKWDAAIRGTSPAALSFEDLNERVCKIAIVLGLQPDDVAPPELLGTKVDSTATRIADVDVARLQEAKCLCLPSSEDVEASAMHDEAKRRIDSVLKTLGSRDREIVKLRFGIPDGNTRSLDEVAARFGVHRERMRQIQANALKKLQHPSRMAQLRGLLE